MLTPKYRVPGKRRTPDFTGFTLIKVIAVMIIVGILPVTLLLKIDLGSTSSTASAAEASHRERELGGFHERA